MAEFNLSQLMDDIATALVGLTDNIYAWPAESVSIPCAIVGYPKEMDFDVTFKRGGDRAVFPIWFVVGKATDKAARDALSAIITGAVSIKNLLDGAIGQSSRVEDVSIETVSISGIAYLAARFDMEVLS